ncbi:MAG: ABC transporter substrate-binding protein [Proteobacteria bacterium]|nr:MAG: ABC transporter substrate-binding protein [Pseudomonadota bacterium]
MRNTLFRMLSLFLCLAPTHAFSAAKNSINLAFEDAVRSFDPRQSADANSQYIEDLVHCSLMNFDPDGKAIPGLLVKAPSWLSPVQLELEVRGDVKFSDGSPVRTEDVVATYKTLMTNPALRRASAFDGVEKFEMLGPGKIRITLKKPDASFPTNLVVGILRESQMNEEKLDPLLLKGCGTFQIKSQTINEILLIPNPYAVPLAKIAEIKIKIVRNEKTRYAKLRAGELDIVQNGISRDTLRTLEKRNPNLKIIKRQSLKTTYLGFNMRDPLFKNAKIRDAISLAINRQEIIQIILQGLATPARTLLPPTSEYFDQGLPVPLHDAKAAEKLLDEAGFPRKDGIRFQLSLKSTTDVTRISIAKAIASQLKRIGIKVVVESMEWGRFKLDLEQGRIQMWAAQWIGFKDPDIYRFAFATANFPPGGANRGWYSNPTLDALLEAGREKNDFSERKKIYDQVQGILATDKPYVFLWHEENFAVVHRELEGFELFADGRYSALRTSYFP